MSFAEAMPFDRRRLLPLADWLAVGVAMSLPWSTSATSILIALWLVAVLPALNTGAIRRAIANPAGYFPILLWLLAALGMLWADVTWGERFRGLDGFDRLLAIPLLLAQFRGSARGAFVLYGFLVSAMCVLAASWLSVLIPTLGVHGKFYGVPVKDYIFQSDEFLLCAFALLGVAGDTWRQKKGACPYAMRFGCRLPGEHPLCDHEPHQFRCSAIFDTCARMVAGKSEGGRAGVPDRSNTCTRAVVQFAPSA